MDVLEILNRKEQASNAELSTALADLRDALDKATTGDNPDLTVARDLREAIDEVVEEQAKREEAAEAARLEAAKLREGLFDDNAESADEADESADESADEPVEVEAEEKQPVAAASRISVIERLKAHAAKVTPAEPEIKLGARLKPVGPAAGYDLDESADFGALGRMFSTHAKSVTQSGSRATLARLDREYSLDRQLGSNLDQNNRRIADVLGFGGQRPVTAAGGLCGPGDVDFTHPICADAGRPVRDSLPAFNASRGRVTFAPAAGLGDLDGNVSIWTAATDSDPGSATKPCPPVACPEELSCEVDAVVQCITVGNFQAKFSPEFWASRLQLLAATFDRRAEQKIIEEIDAASTALPDYAAGGNTLANFLQAVNSIVAADRSAQRNLSGNYVVLADAWLRDQIRNQVIAGMGVANNVDVIQVADAVINGWLADVNVTAVWTYDGTLTDGGTHNVLTPGGAAPATARIYVYPEDAFVFLDGGTLDLGTEIHDSLLNATNDRQAFAESFEKTCFRGCSAYKQDVTVVNACGCSQVQA